MAVAFVSAGTAVAGTTTLTVAWPGSQSAGDIGLMLIETANAATVVASGWTELSTSPVESSISVHGLHVLYKIAEGSDTDVSVSGLLNHAIARILVFSGVDGTSPINATTQQAAATGTSITLPSVTTDTADCAIVHVAGTGRDTTSTAVFSDWANGNLASITEVADDTTGTAGGGGFGAAWGILASAGESGTGSCTQSVSVIWSAITVALKPAGSGAIAGVSDITLGAATVSSAGVLAINGTLTRTLDDSNLVGTGALSIAGSISTTLSPATLSATGELVTPGGGSLTATLADATVSSSGKLAIGATASITLDALTTTGIGQISIAGTLSSTLEDVTLVFAGSAPSEVSLTEADLLAIAEAVWSDPVAVAAHAKLDAIIARLTC